MGAGSVGQALGRLLSTDFQVLIASRSRAREGAAFIGSGARAVTLETLADESGCIVVAVPDRAVPEVAGSLAVRRPQVVLQTCGALGPTDLRPLGELGTSCATFHPLQTFPTARSGVEKLPGSSFGVCGSGTAAIWCERLAHLLHGSLLHVSEDQLPLYHAAAVLASNCAVGLADAAASLMVHVGVDRAAALRALRPLLETSLENAITMEAEQALTGPVARGDVGTVGRHLRAMQDLPMPLRRLYQAFGQYLVSIGVRRGLSPSEAASLQRLLDGEH